VTEYNQGMADPASPHRRLFWLSFVALFALVALFAVWLGFSVRPAQQQRTAMQVLTNAGAFPFYSYPNALVARFAGWAWMDHDYFAKVSSVNFPGGATHLEERNGRTFLVKSDYMHVAPEALACLKELPWLTELHLCQTDIEDSDLPLITRLHGLRGLDLKGTKITDAGLEQLKSMKSLERLDVRDTFISQAGARMIIDALPDAVVITKQTPRAE
jgi:hypothetical protein